MKLRFFNSFELLTKKNGLLSKFFGAVVNTAFNVSLGPFWGKTFIEKTVIYKQFLTSSKNFWPFGNVSSWSCQKCNLCVCIRTFLGESAFWRDLHFGLYIFGHRDKFLAFHLKSFKAVVKTAFCLSFTTIWAYKKKFQKEMKEKKNWPFWNIGRKICDFLTKLFPRGFQNCIPRLHLKHSEEEIFLEKVICLIILSGNWRKNSGNCGKIFSARLLPLLCKYPRKQFKEGQFYREKKQFYHFQTLGFFSFFIENI